jgi:transcriptional regulator NrdR family protein
MRCDQCGGNTEVLETVQAGKYTRRRRQCLHCGARFTTHEMPREELQKNAEDSVPAWLEKAVKRGKRLDQEAIMAAVRTDRRRAKIREEQLALARKERDAMRDAGFDDQADELDAEMLRRELEGW